VPQDDRPEEDDDDVDDEAETRKPPEVKVKQGAAPKRAEPAATKRAARDDDDDEPDADDDDVDDEAETRKPPAVAEADADDEPEDEQQAARVAEALGLDEEGESKPKSAPVEDEGPQNRANRRRDEARERRRKRREGAKEAVVAKARVVVDDDDLPKDRNARAKELLLRRREQAAGGGRAVQSALLPGEMVDDALARTASAFSKWFRGNWNVIQWVLGGAILVAGGLVFWNHQKEKTSGNASSALAAAVLAERGKVMEEDKRPDEEKELDPAKVFKTPEERSQTAFAAYKKVVDEHGGSGAAILAQLGIAGLHLDKKEYDQALAAYATVLSTSLAGADPDVKGRAIEGTGLAKEAKEDIDGALKAFKDLEAIDAKGYKELALYHQARLHLAKGDKEKAKELLKSARDKLMAPGVDGHPFQFLEAVVDETLRKIDPTSVPPKTSLSGPKGPQMTMEELEKIQKKIRDMTEKKAGEHDDEH
jgi:tetratricopeptide (TPR) repeat protein